VYSFNGLVSWAAHAVGSVGSVASHPT